MKNNSRKLKKGIKIKVFESRKIIKNSNGKVIKINSFGKQKNN